MTTKQELAAFRARIILAVQHLEAHLGRRLNQTELAERWDVSQGSVSQWLAGKSAPEDHDIIKRVAKDCCVDPGWLDWGTIPAEGGIYVDWPAEGSTRKRGNS